MKRTRGDALTRHRSDPIPFARTWPNNRTATHDPRWPEVAAALAILRDGKRHAVRIVDADCGAGCLLLQALRHARTLGFTAIEGRGIDSVPTLIGRARAAAARLRDPAICVEFEVSDVTMALRQEHDLPADIIVWRHAGTVPADLAVAVRLAGDRVIGDQAAPLHRRAA